MTPLRCQTVVEVRRRRTRVAVDHNHLAAAASKRDRDEQAGRTRPDDDYSHIGSELR